jgi:hypothetical protein
MCGCRTGLRKTVTASGAPVGGFTYEVTFPGDDVPTPFLTALEAKVAVRKAGGGNIRRKAAA